MIGVVLMLAAVALLVVGLHIVFGESQCQVRWGFASFGAGLILLFVGATLRYPS